MSAELFLWALGVSGCIAFIGTLLTFLFDVPKEGEEVVPWSEFDAENMTEEQIDAKLRAGLRRERLYGFDRYKYAMAFPSVIGRQFVEFFIPGFLSSLLMVYVVCHFS